MYLYNIIQANDRDRPANTTVHPHSNANANWWGSSVTKNTVEHKSDNQACVLALTQM